MIYSLQIVSILPIMWSVAKMQLPVWKCPFLGRGEEDENV